MLRLSHVPRQLYEVVKYFVDSGFIKLNVMNNNVQRITYGPLGEILLENIRKEWIFGNSSYREDNVFPYHYRSVNEILPDIKEAFIAGKELNGGVLPFGLADCRKICSDFKSSENDIFHPRHSIDLRYIGFFKPDEGKQFFYRWAQQRKRWWRKFSSDPGKFSLGEIEKDETSDKEELKILATFPWGVHNIESVKFLGDTPFLNCGRPSPFNIDCDGELIFPHVIESVCSLDYATIIYLLDAYDRTDDSKVICRFHRKFAPYKFAFAAPPVDDRLAFELFEMGQMLCFDVMKAGLNCLLPVRTLFGKEELEKQLDKNNSIGVPYTAVLTDHTLKTGIFGLFSRETTLQEEIHIEKFKDYGALLMKNY
ncbi:uncharacterized protein LOC106670963 [Cimex lectularius]|uniref:Anticodon-binding domain-containing protein n=1 Tax=Cimex lectularius TaxID=79782 RepID=A0A8I6SM69_CIMLE|nr:uncharacterized protein LOC106670963 [Cimex lectularius]